MWPNDVKLDEEGIDNIESIDRLPIATRKEELASHGDDDDEKDVIDNEITELDCTEAIQGRADQYGVDGIVYQEVVNGEGLYRVQCYRYKANKDTAEPADQLPDHFFKAYWRGRNHRKCLFRNRY